MKKSIYDDLSVVSRQLMSIKWRQIDEFLAEHEQAQDIIQCKICGYKAERGSYATVIENCIFGGGRLERYICPYCGVIFGPTKFLNQGEYDIAEDYRVHYLGYQEGDSTYKEERAFYMLNPSKEKIYLNYGCGSWSKSLQNLRDKGYQVYGYEPYSVDFSNAYMISKEEELKKYCFDGIYSNDVLEHFVDPIRELIFMKGLLKDSTCKMVHATACYTYKYAHTRFHIHFFTGNSVAIMARRAELEMVECCRDLEQNDFYAYVYQPCEVGQECFDAMFVGENAEKTGDEIVLWNNGYMYGPYISLPAGRYHVLCTVYLTENCLCRITSNKGLKILYEKMVERLDVISFDVQEEEQDVEFFIQNTGSEKISITSVVIKLEVGQECFDAMFVGENAKKTCDEIVLWNSGSMYGPYITLSAGRYSVLFTAYSAGNCLCKITSNKGAKILHEEMVERLDIINFEIQEEEQDVEFFIQNIGSEKISVMSVTIRSEEGGK